jgi:hypothetical protein
LTSRFASEAEARQYPDMLAGGCANGQSS